VLCTIWTRKGLFFVTNDYIDYLLSAPSYLLHAECVHHQGSMDHNFSFYELHIHPTLQSNPYSPPLQHTSLRLNVPHKLESYVLDFL
jgi:hypothetical protein